MQILLRDGKINPAFSSSPGPSSQHVGSDKSEQCKDYLLLPCRKAELIPVTPVTKHKQLLSVTAFLQGSCPFGVSKMNFQEKKPQPVSSDNHVNQTPFMFIPSSAPKASADIRTSPIRTLQRWPSISIGK